MASTDMREFLCAVDVAGLVGFIHSITSNTELLIDSVDGWRLERRVLLCFASDVCLRGKLGMGGKLVLGPWVLMALFSGMDGVRPSIDEVSEGDRLAEGSCNCPGHPEIVLSLPGDRLIGVKPLCDLGSEPCVELVQRLLFPGDREPSLAVPRLREAARIRRSSSSLGFGLVGSSDLLRIRNGLARLPYGLTGCAWGMVGESLATRGRRSHLSPSPGCSMGLTGGAVPTCHGSAEGGLGGGSEVASDIAERRELLLSRSLTDRGVMCASRPSSGPATAPIILLSCSSVSSISFSAVVDVGGSTTILVGICS